MTPFGSPHWLKGYGHGQTVTWKETPEEPRPFRIVCDKCGSEDVELWPTTSDTMWFDCHSCGCHWEGSL